MGQEVIEFRKYGLYIKPSGESIISSFINSNRDVRVRCENILRGLLMEEYIVEDVFKKHGISKDDFMLDFNSFFNDNNNLANLLYQKTKEFVYDKIKNNVLQDPYNDGVYFCYHLKIRISKNCIVYFDKEDRTEPVFFKINEEEFNNLIASNKWLKR